jgi:hypothetical protein
MRLRPAWIQTSLHSLIRIHAVRLQTDAQAGLDPCWSQTHNVGFVKTRLILLFYLIIISISVKEIR